ncbi:hypothetical protein [Paraburkholderia aspalathi]|uniref:hypothetical protein n=1 Tax=Paraburkholderia aspalathi TaxID=1324617 RepID=UPI001BA5CFDE|nr:hypothetical protein [Paraburkholderia aspalathi]
MTIFEEGHGSFRVGCRRPRRAAVGHQVTVAAFNWTAAVSTSPAIRDRQMTPDPCGVATGELLQILRELSAQRICHLLQDIQQENLRLKWTHN